MLKAPFNFVPLSGSNNKPYEPYIAKWANLISQDIPFEDGISGTINLKITAESPIFIDDGVKKPFPDVHKFCHVDGAKGEKQYFIPATSVKGMIRAVMEILSFGKMMQVQDQSFGIRDLTIGDDGKFYRGLVNTNSVRCGWLRYENGSYVLKDCGFPWRISANNLDNKFKMGLMNFIKEKDNFKSDEESDKNKTAQKKYEMFFATGRKLEELTATFVDAGMDYGRKLVNFGQGNKRGTIVFTGQPGARNAKKGKYLEFVFPEKYEKDGVTVSDSVFKAFNEIHENSTDYVNFRKEQLKAKEEIPIFFIYGEGERVETIGLSYMFKYPAFNSVYDAIPEKLLSREEHDLCECIFGFTGKEESLKGRVQFSPAMLTTTVPSSYEEEIGSKVTLVSPHPSYFPFYLGKGQTWNSADILIAGRKRYPVRNDESPNAGPNDMSRPAPAYRDWNDGPNDMSRVIRPLPPKSEFEETIRFHNLRPIELGALLSAIDFCKHNECFHSLGMGKPLGLGKVKLSVNREDIQYVFGDISNTTSISDEARETFIKEMGQFCNFSDKYAESLLLTPQWRELFAMAEGVPVGRESEFEYMQMSTTPDDNEFANGLKEYSDGCQLGTFTEIKAKRVPDIVAKPVRAKHRNYKGLELRQADIVAQAQEAYANGNYREAQRLYEEILPLDIDKYKVAIADCQKQVDRQKTEKETVLKALEAYNNGNFSKAKALYETAVTYGFADYCNEIEACQKELAYQQEQEETLQRKRNEAEKKANEAKEAYDNKEYEKAIDLYKQAASYGFETYQKEIEDCRGKIEEINARKGDISSFLEKLKLASVNAFATQMKKRHEAAPVTSNDVPLIIQKIKKDWDSLESKYRKIWPERKNWSAVEKALGADITNAIYDGIKDLITK